MRAHSLVLALLAAAALAGCAEYYQGRVQNAENQRQLYGGPVSTFRDTLPFDNGGPTPSGSAVRR
jgi:hypothetical protein